MALCFDCCFKPPPLKSSSSPMLPDLSCMPSPTPPLTTIPHLCFVALTDLQCWRLEKRGGPCSWLCCWTETRGAGSCPRPRSAFPRIRFEVFVLINSSFSGTAGQPSSVWASLRCSDLRRNFSPGCTRPLGRIPAASLTLWRRVAAAATSAARESLFRAKSRDPRKAWKELK